VTVSGSGLTWEQFKDTKVVVEADTGVFIADGDTPFFSMKQLREFYEMNVRDGQLIVNRIGSADDKWNDTQKLNLTYCVSKKALGSNYNKAVTAMAAAASAWEATANVNFVHVVAQDGNCTNRNTSVVFNVGAVCRGSYVARAFFPSYPRRSREVLIDCTAWGDLGAWTVDGVLRHELGHTLGFRHEHTRPEAGTCFEDNNWAALTAYDSASVMHYPQCNGSQNGDLVLTAQDKTGAALLYP